MALVNATPFLALDVPMLDAQGREVVVVIVKATFNVLKGGRTVLADDPSPIRVADELYDPDAPQSSVRYPSDVSLEKPGTDVIVVGEAFSPRPVSFVDVGVKVRDKLVPLRVHGERLFYRSFGNVVIGPAAPFERKPIVYERAYGGATEDFTVVEPRNPVGVGVARREVDLVDTPAPQIEHPGLPHKTAADRHPPVGFGAILPNWSPRREYAGTFDQQWQEERMPLLPVDFDPRYSQCAHPSLVFEGRLAAGDAMSVVGMSPEVMAFEVPTMPVVVRARFERTGKVVMKPLIDMLVVDPARCLLDVSIREMLPVGRRDALREIVVVER